MQKTTRRGPATKRARRFQAKLFRIAPGSWVFVRVPAKHAPPPTHAWGRTPVIARVDDKSWDTSVWWDTERQATLLAIPKRIRGAKEEGDVVDVELLPPRGHRLW